MSEFSIRTKPYNLGWPDYRVLWLSEYGRAFTRFPTAIGTLCALFGVPAMLGFIYKSFAIGVIAQAAVILGYGAILVMTVAGLWWRYRGAPVMRGERIALLSHGAVRLIGPGFDLRQTWAAFEFVAETRRHLILRMRDYSSYVIPKSAFASADDVKRLLRVAPAVIRAARRTSADLQPLPESPEGRELWRSRPYRMTFNLAFGRGLRVIAVVCLIALGCGLVVLAAQFWLDGRADPHDLTGLFGSIITGMILGLLAAPLSWLILRRRPAFRGDRDLCFTRDYVRYTAPAYDCRFEWVHVRDVRRHANIIVFRLAIGRLSVPRSAFATPAEADAFFTQAVAFRHAMLARQ